MRRGRVEGRVEGRGGEGRGMGRGEGRGEEGGGTTSYHISNKNSFVPDDLFLKTKDCAFS